jgi:2,5-diamino-6-(ribosylamino)-4(3H)-pyrimidinone 5'-phosphate reductase
VGFRFLGELFYRAKPRHFPLRNETTARTTMSALTLPPSIAPFLTSYLPRARSDRPFVTLTYAASLDSHLSLSPGVQTALSGLETKALTHYLRTYHAAILVGVSTAAADNPGLNSRLENTPLAQQPRPIVLDPRFRWWFTREARVLRTAREGKGNAPWIFVASSALHAEEERVRWVEEAGGRVIPLDDPQEGERWSWRYLLSTMHQLGLESVMVEGGAGVINDLLSAENRALVDSVVVTVAPVYLGQGGVNVSPQREERERAAVRFRDVEWAVLGRDVVMAARLELE